MKNESPKLRCTRDYDMFVNSPENRTPCNFSKLRKSMAKYGFIPAYPIHVIRNGSGKLKIRDGGNRFEAAKAEGKPIWFVELPADDISIPEINNASKRWSWPDYIGSYSRIGKDDYKILDQFRRNYGITVAVACSLLAGEQARSANACKKVKDDTFRVTNYDFAEKVAQIIQSISEVSPLARNTEFQHAISRLCLVEQFDPARFTRNCQRCAPLLVPKATIDDYLDLCEAIYNHHVQRGRFPLKFEANEASKRRDIKNGKVSH